MVKSSSSSENEACCSKSCKKNTDSLNSKITELTNKLSDSENMLYHYKLGLSQVEARLVEFKNQEVKFCEKIRGLELKVEFKIETIECLTNELKLLKKEKEGLDSKLAGFQSASKNLDNLLESQRSDKNKEGLGYNAVPPSLLLNWPSPAIESTLDDLQNRNPSVTEIGTSDSSILSKPAIKFVKAVDRPIENKTDKVETVKKPAVKYAKMYRKTSKRSNVRGNQRNWNNMKSQQLGKNSLMKNKACYNCELLKKEKEGLDSKLTGFQSASKNLDNLLESQRSDKNKEGLGYNVVPLPLTQVYSPPKKDMSWTGLPEFVDDTITNYSRPSPAIESTSDDLQNKNPFVTENGASDSSILSKLAIMFVKEVDRPTENKTNKVETVKKPAVKYVEMYRKTLKRSNVRGNHRNWNNMKSQQLGKNFLMKNKTCYNCGKFDHLSYDCGKWVKRGKQG
uniref:Ubiquitin hydrolase n=1 Tax=Tanacetum cinerariifolium TaxID=118510 RepID=A0A6L2KZI8_TANCI|nr:ubiquitin hydrolase [Tanacetum cinerariifolium]